MTKHRQIWKNYYGKIPKDAQGRPYDIHHINGNKKDNRIENLQCLSMQDHYELHLLQGDFAHAYRHARRLGIEIENPIDLLSHTNRKRLEAGTHPFLNQDARIKAKREAFIKERVEKGVQGFQNPLHLQQALSVKAELYSSEQLSGHIRKGWETWKENNPDVLSRTMKGTLASIEKTLGTKWYNKDGVNVRLRPDDERILVEGWVIGQYRKNKKDKNNELHS